MLLGQVTRASTDRANLESMTCQRLFLGLKLQPGEAVFSPVPCRDRWWFGFAAHSSQRNRLAQFSGRSSFRGTSLDDG